MADRLEYPFGSIDVETASRWMHLAPDEDGPVWMLNLMKYKPVADYGEAGGPAISGREADDVYAPTAVLDDLGATGPLFGDVVHQATDDVAWERIAMVRYPSRSSFFAMQERDDFKRQYVHKKAGMETTIVMGCVPSDPAMTTADPAAAGGGDLVVRVRRFAQDASPGPDPAGVVPVAHFTVDGVILGDGRRWDDVRVDRMDADGLAAVVGAPGLADQVAVIVDPLLESLADSLTVGGA